MVEVRTANLFKMKLVDGSGTCRTSHAYRLVAPPLRRRTDVGGIHKGLPSD